MTALKEHALSGRAGHARPAVLSFGSQPLRLRGFCFVGVELGQHNGIITLTDSCVAIYQFVIKKVFAAISLVDACGNATCALHTGSPGNPGANAHAPSAGCSLYLGAPDRTAGPKDGAFIISTEGLLEPTASPGSSTSAFPSPIKDHTLQPALCGLVSCAMVQRVTPFAFIAQSDQTMYALLATLEAGQATILAELKAINTRLTSTEQTLADLVARIAQTEDQCKLLPDMRSDVDVLLHSSTQTSDSIAGIEERLNDAEDRLRRCNLVFYGISEGESESWSDSEKLCTTKLYRCKVNISEAARGLAQAPKPGRRTSIGQKLPEEFEDKLINFQHFVNWLWEQNDYMMGQICKADETPVLFDMSSSTTITQRGAKDVKLLSTGNEHSRFTVMLTCTADG
ncbi:hypothetical protein HPB51_000825 [Rhipicephalus microplus]|uniref:Uncharacterized protein n=1 Tax=Rhipicephalus microplus TaxID=6941 RepID=A0A9J6EJP8_RHIMP|nr:hypothetical protein HPB51_000825 [Rhipicephalus microplus]